MYWLFGQNSKSPQQQNFVYEARLKPAWTYDIHLWDTPSTSNIEILELLQCEALLMIVVAPWFLPNTII
jgi:hypothetical protein